MIRNGEYSAREACRPRLSRLGPPPSILVPAWRHETAHSTPLTYLNLVTPAGSHRTAPHRTTAISHRITPIDHRKRDHDDD